MRKILFLFLITVLFLSGCATKTTNEQGSNTAAPAANTGSINNCETGAVQIEGYGDPGKRLSNCFVQYPGEPSRQDKSYYIVEDICGQFTSEFIGNLVGQKIVKAEASPIPSVYACHYFFNDKDYVMLVLDYLEAAKQKIGNEFMGRKVETDSRIPMNNYVVYQEDGTINVIQLILADSKFISLNRSSSKVLGNEGMLNFAIKLAEAIKSYK